MNERILKFSATREQLASELDRVVTDHIALKIIRKIGNVVVISEDDYAALEETAYLLSSRRNARRLHDAMGQEPKTLKKDGDTQSLKI
jgi:antitoxin YefM